MEMSEAVRKTLAVRGCDCRVSGANSDRTSETITPTSGPATTYRYCYGIGDQLLSSTDPSVGTLAYDSHGNINVHGDVIATANATGTKQGATALYDPFGNALSGTKPDNSPGDMDNQWLGGPQRPTEHQTGLIPIIEMGSRQYNPATGRFLSIDPIQGGAANQYDYVWGDPINAYDIAGTSGHHDTPSSVRYSN